MHRRSIENVALLATLAVLCFFALYRGYHPRRPLIDTASQPTKGGGEALLAWTLIDLTPERWGTGVRVRLIDVRPAVGGLTASIKISSDYGRTEYELPVSNARASRFFGDILPGAQVVPVPDLEPRDASQATDYFRLVRIPEEL